MPAEWGVGYVRSRYGLYQRRSARNLRAYLRAEERLRERLMQTTENTPQRTTIKKPPLRRPRPGGKK